MASTREQAEAYAYDNRRRTTSLIRGADEARLDPRRRLNRALGGGVAFGVLIMAGFGIAGWLGGGKGPQLPESGAVVVGGSGDRYVVNDGVVHPALNLASALLVGGGSVTDVKQSVLDDAPRGLPIGIPYAPDALPGADSLVDDPWTLCATPSETGGAPAETVLYVSVPGLAPGRDAAAAETTVLVQEDGGGLWLLTEGRRYALSEGTRGVLGLQGAEPVPLPRQVIATVPEGPGITLPEQASGTGDVPGVELPDGAVVGDLAHADADGANPQYFLVRPDGLVSVSPLVHTLLSVEADLSHELTATEAARAPRSEERAPGDRAWPDALPEVDEPGRNQPVCVSSPPGSEPGDVPWEARVHLPRSMPSPSDLTAVRASDGERLGLLDMVYLPAGSGTVVRAVVSGGAGGTYTLVTDSGTAYPIASAEAVERLRYQPADAPSLPRSFVNLLPSGPVLDPQEAAQEHRGQAPSSDTGDQAAPDTDEDTDENGEDS